MANVHSLHEYGSGSQTQVIFVTPRENSPEPKAQVITKNEEKERCSDCVKVALLLLGIGLLILSIFCLLSLKYTALSALKTTPEIGILICIIGTALTTMTSYLLSKKCPKKSEPIKHEPPPLPKGSYILGRK